MPAKAKCVRPGCKNKANGWRGLCKHCYSAAHHLVYQGRTTWQELESKGFAKPDARKSDLERELAKTK